MIQTEKATYEPDLPHRYVADSGQPDSDCRCGRTKSDPLHDTDPLPEKASAMFETEKGS